MVWVLYLLEVFVLAHYGPPSTETPTTETTIVRCHENSWIYLSSTYLLLVTFETNANYSIRFEISNNSSTIRFEMKKNTIRTELVTVHVSHPYTLMLLPYTFILLMNHEYNKQPNLPSGLAGSSLEARYPSPYVGCFLDPPSSSCSTVRLFPPNPPRFPISYKHTSHTELYVKLLMTKNGKDHWL